MRRYIILSLLLLGCCTSQSVAATSYTGTWKTTTVKSNGTLTVLLTMKGKSLTALSYSFSNDTGFSSGATSFLRPVRMKNGLITGRYSEKDFVTKKILSTFVTQVRFRSRTTGKGTVQYTNKEDRITVKKTSVTFNKCANATCQ